MNKEKLQEQVNKSWNSKSQHDWELSCNLNSDNTVITWDEYIETNRRYAAFEIAFEKLGFTLPCHV